MQTVAEARWHHKGITMAGILIWYGMVWFSCWVVGEGSRAGWDPDFMEFRPLKQQMNSERIPFWYYEGQKFKRFWTEFNRFLTELD